MLMNQLIADKIVETYNDVNDEETTVWIHDYHLLLVPKMVRDKLPNAKIGFFLHVSFLLQKFSVVLLKETSCWKVCWRKLDRIPNQRICSSFCKRVIGCYWPIQVNWESITRATLP